MISKNRTLPRLAGIAALLTAGAVLPLSAAAHAAPIQHVPSIRNGTVISNSGTTLVVTTHGGGTYTVSFAPTAGLHHRFYGSFSLGNLSQVQTHDQVKLTTQPNGSHALVASFLQDYSVQVAHSEVKGQGVGVAPGNTSFTMKLTAVFGGTNAAFSTGQVITVHTPNPTSTKVTYAQGGPSCGNVSCLTTGVYLEFYGLSDRPNLNINNPQGLVQVQQYTAQVVHATAD